MTRPKRKWFSFRTFLSIVTVFLVGYVLYQNWDDILQTLDSLQYTNIVVLLLLIPEQLFMYYACGQIFFSYLKQRRGVKKFSRREVLRISTELNFVNHAIPAGGVGGLAFLTYRMGAYGISAGQTSFLYIFRYAVTTVVNYLQAILAIVILLMMQAIPEGAMWIVPVALIMNMAVFGFLWFVIFVAGNKKRIESCSRIISRLMNWMARTFTFGRKKEMIKYERVSQYFADIHESVEIAKANKKYLKKPLIWGIVYSFCEVGTYWIVAIALGQPWLLPFIMIGEAIGSVFDGIVPYGLYELGMAGVMVALGVEAGTALLITVMTRVLTLVFTIVSGIVPYYRVIRGKEGSAHVRK